MLPDHRLLACLQIVLAGGAASMTKVKGSLVAFFGREIVEDSIPPDEVWGVVVIG